MTKVDIFPSLSFKRGIDGSNFFGPGDISKRAFSARMLEWLSKKRDGGLEE